MLLTFEKGVFEQWHTKKLCNYEVIGGNLPGHIRFGCSSDDALESGGPALGGVNLPEGGVKLWDHRS